MYNFISSLFDALRGRNPTLHPVLLIISKFIRVSASVLADHSLKLDFGSGIKKGFKTSFKCQC